jgi:hypothetical protein
MRRTAVLLALLAAAPAAAQSRWQPIGKTGDANPVLVDARSVKRKGPLVDATVRVQFLKPKKMPGGDVTSSRTAMTFDCSKETVAVKVNTYFYDEKANKVFQRSEAKLPGFGPVMGGSMTKVAYDHLCKTK